MTSAAHATYDSGDEDDDDLELTGVLNRPRSAVPDRNLSHNTKVTAPKPPQTVKHEPPPPVAPQIISSDDGDSDDSEFNDAEAAYNEFKNRKKLKRKRGGNTTTSAKTKAKTKSDSFVGLRPRDQNEPRKKRRRFKDYGEVSSEDDGMEYTMPDYVQKRRSQFDRGTETLRQSGLKLPPDFDDVDFSDDERLESLAEKPVFGDIEPCREYKDITLPYSLGIIPAPIAQWLRQYQVDGAAFLHELFVYQKGGILGDDMGLGKTVQVLAFLTAAYGKTGDERDAKRMRKSRRSDQNKWYPRTLIVCPGTLIRNWRSEFERWGWWHVEVYHGVDKDQALLAAKSGRVEVLITTYTTYRNNRSSVNMVEWDCVVADECHQFKERTSETTKAMDEINALCRIGLTGTAIQNKYEELWTLLNWTNPGKLGPLSTWKKVISEPLKIGQSHDATVYQLSKARKTAKKLVENLLPQFFLRRMKSLIAEQLPKKSDRVVFCPLTQTQADGYLNFLDSDIVSYIKHSSEMCDCNSGKKAGWCCRRIIPGRGSWQSYVFPAIANLQKLSNHLAILIPQGADALEKQDKDLEMLEIAVPGKWQKLYRTRDSIVNYANPEFCGKWKVLRKLLKWWHANGDKVLVFSHSVRLLKMLQMLFQHTSYNVSYLDGAMSYEERARVVDEYNSDPQQFVFLISTRAGGIGLNITSANKVVVVDPNWNPSHDLQAQDRAYRIGQHRDVEVFRLISAGTIEEIVYARQIYKQQQANIGYNASSERRYFKGVQEKKDQKGEIFGLTNLFEYNKDNVVLRDIVNKTNVAESKAGVDVLDIELKNEQDASNAAGASEESDPNNDTAISQLAATICGSDEKNKESLQALGGGGMTQQPKHDPIQAILAGAGVEYTHMNNEVIGSSKVEERLSRRAELVDSSHSQPGDLQVFPNSQDYRNNVVVMARSNHRQEQDQQQQQQQQSGNGNAAGNDRSPNGDGETIRRIEFKYHPPPDVAKRQFCSMARRFGFSNATEFALVVEGMTQAQRRACLERWYRERTEVLLNT